MHDLGLGLIDLAREGAEDDGASLPVIMLEGRGGAVVEGCQRADSRLQDFEPLLEARACELNRTRSKRRSAGLRARPADLCLRLGSDRTLAYAKHLLPSESGYHRLREPTI